MDGLLPHEDTDGIELEHNLALDSEHSPPLRHEQLEDHITENGTTSAHPARPLLLSPLAGWSLIALLITLDILLISLTAYSHANNGLFTINPAEGIQDAVLRSIWSSGPTLVTTAISGGILVPMALAIFLVAPYAELEKEEGASADESIQVNYANAGNWRRLGLLWRNRKWGLISLSIAVFLAYWLDVASSGFIESRNVIIFRKIEYQNTARLGLEYPTDATNGTTDDQHNYLFLDTDLYFAAVLFAGGQQLYRPSPPPFAYYDQEENWSIVPFNLSAQDLQSLVYRQSGSTVGNITVDTYGVNTNANCQNTSISFGAGNTSIATLGNCSFTFDILGMGPNKSTSFPRWHNATTVNCTGSPTDFAFETFVYEVYRPTAAIDANKDPNQFVITFCQPIISIAKISATLSVFSDGSIGPLTKPPTIKHSDPADPNIAALMAPPLNGKAVNGFQIAETWGLGGIEPGASRITRANLTQSILQEGIYGTLHHYMGEDNALSISTDWFTETNRTKIVGIVSGFYQAYLNAFAPNVYYNTSVSGAKDIADLALPVARAQVSLLHAVGLTILLFLLAILMAITLRTQALPADGSYVWRLYRGTMQSHIAASSARLSRAIRPQSSIWTSEPILPTYDRLKLDDNEGIMLHSKYQRRPSVNPVPHSPAS